MVAKRTKSAVEPFSEEADEIMRREFEKLAADGEPFVSAEEIKALIDERARAGD